MATLNPGIVSLFNLEPQQLYTIEDPLQNGVPAFVAGNSSVVVTFDNATANLGSGVSYDSETGVISVDGDSSYLITARIDTTSKTPTSIRWVETSSGNVFGAPVAAGETLTLVVNPAEANDYQLEAFTDNGSRFEYPSAITNASLTVQQVYNITVSA
jgi:hypothetical protein